MVYYDPTSQSRPTGGVNLVITINDNPINTQGQTLYTQKTFRKGDIIITNFSIEGCTEPVLTNPNNNKGIILNEGILPDLVIKQPAIGVVTEVPIEDDQDHQYYAINFNTSRPNVNEGLKLNTLNGDTAIGIDKLSLIRPRTKDGQIFANHEANMNVSGVNTIAPAIYESGDSSSAGVKTVYTVYPTGGSPSLFDNNDNKEASRTSNGLYIKPNFSMCIIPDKAFYPLSEPEHHVPLANWPTGIYHQDSPLDSSIGVNLEKIIDNPYINSSDPADNDWSRAINISGLRVNTDIENLSSNWFGHTTADAAVKLYYAVNREPWGWDDTYFNYYTKNDGSYVQIPEASTPPTFDSFTEGVYKAYSDVQHSGGLSVNVGDFLKIGYANNISRASGGYRNKEDFYEDGKVNLNVDYSLGLGEINNGSNELGIRIGDGTKTYEVSETRPHLSTKQGGLTFVKKYNDSSNLGYLSVKVVDNSGDSDGLEIGYGNTVGVKLYNTINDTLNDCSKGKINQPKVLDVKTTLIENDLIEHVMLRGVNPADESQTASIVEKCFKDLSALRVYYWDLISYDYDHHDASNVSFTQINSDWNVVYNVNGTRYIWDTSEIDHSPSAYNNLENIVTAGKYGYFKRLFNIYQKVDDVDPLDDGYILLKYEPNAFDPTNYYKKEGSSFVSGNVGEEWEYNKWYRPITTNDKRYVQVIFKSDKGDISPTDADYRSIKDGEIEIYTWVVPSTLLVPNAYKGNYDPHSEEWIQLADARIPVWIYTDLSTTPSCYLYSVTGTNHAPIQKTYFVGTNKEATVWVGSRMFRIGSKTHGGTATTYVGYYNTDDDTFYDDPNFNLPFKKDTNAVYIKLDPLNSTIVLGYYYYENDSNSFIELDASEIIFYQDDPTTRTVLFARPVDPTMYDTIIPLNIPTNTLYPYELPYKYNEYPEYAYGDTEYYRPAQNVKSQIFTTPEIMARYDTNRDGVVDAKDASNIKYFVENYEIFDGTTCRQRWKSYCLTPKEDRGLGFKDLYDYNETPPEASWNLMYTDDSSKVGLRLNFNPHMGLTSNMNSYIFKEDEKDHSGYNESLAIKIADRSSGLYDFDTAINGGLRFGADGYLAIRINDNNNYDATIPTKRGRSYRGEMVPESLDKGTHGLRIYDGNILGVQLSPNGAHDNGTLAIDASGCLRISPNYAGGGGGGEKFKIHDAVSGQTLEYNGGTEVVLEIGPGLELSAT